MMENRPEFLAVTMGLAKAGVTIALININVAGSLLVHAVTVAAARHAVVSAAQQGAWEAAWRATGSACPVAATVFETLDVSAQPASRPDRAAVRNLIKPRDPLYYIYTSGTTGPSKAALFSVRAMGRGRAWTGWESGQGRLNRGPVGLRLWVKPQHLRFIGCALTWARPCGLAVGDRYYVTLPLFHGSVAIGAQRSMLGARHSRITARPLPAPRPAPFPASFPAPRPAPLPAPLPAPRPAHFPPCSRPSSRPTSRLYSHPLPAPRPAQLPALPCRRRNAGFVAVAAAYFAGATVVLRRKFSASAFLPDVIKYRCTAVAYIGELWRYIQLQPASPLDRAHAIKVVVGNGLRADTWTAVVTR